MIINRGNHMAIESRGRPSGAESGAAGSGIAFLALSCVGFIASPALAQDAGDTAAGQPARLGGVVVTDTVIESSYDRKESSSVKFTQPLLDTPKSVTVIPQEVISDRAFLSLTDVLRATPGITLGAGEGGTPMGDRPFIRGFEAANDMLVDGIRNVGRFNYEVFNLEAVEVVKGPSGVQTGRGSTGGTVNMITKTPQAENFIGGSMVLGTDETKRLTVDVNQQLSDTVAIRVNAMGHDADVAGRDVVTQSRYGFSPSLTIGLGTPTRATIAYHYLKTDAIPDVGMPFANSGTETPLKVGRDNFYGHAGRDFHETEGQLGSLTIEHDITDAITIRNSTRLVRQTNEAIFSRPDFASEADAQAGIVRVSFRGSNRKTTGFLNQTDVRGEFDTGGVTHNFIGGVEYSKEKIYSRNAWQSTEATTTQNLFNPNPHAAFPAIFKDEPAGNIVPSRQEAIAAFLFDTLTLSEQFEVNLGLRYDDYEASGLVGGDRIVSKTDFWNYQAGLVYKPVPNASLYVNYSTSSNPSGEALGQSGGADGPAGGNLNDNKAELDPERAKSWELGAKWDLFDEQLSLTGAVFQIKKNNQRATDPITGEVSLIGKTRVRGFEVGFSGNITPEWNVFGGYTYIDPELVDDGAGANDGNVVKFIAKNTFNLWTTYDVTQRINIGGGINYVGSRWVDDANTKRLPGYVRFDATAGYQVSENVDVRLNIQNLTNKTYYDASHVGVFAVVAPGRSALLSASVRF